MELGLGIAVPATGARADVAVRTPEGTCLADVSEQLLSRVLPAGTSGTLCVDGQPVPATAVVGEPPLINGALLRVDAAARHARPPALLELRCTGGPDAGATWPLLPGEVVLGRGAAAQVRVDDPDLSREHCRLRVPHPPEIATVEDLGSTNGTYIGTVRITQPTTITLGTQVRIGKTILELRK